MRHSVAFHLGLNCLPKYLFRDFQYTRGKNWQDVRNSLLQLYTKPFNKFILFP